ncbi:hypothetical protein ES703_55907 [subsurface metagenome]
MAKKKQPPPAKIKYDKSHPIISIRVSEDLKEQLDEIREMSGKSIGDILREAVGVQSKSVKIARKIGHGLAKAQYGVRYKCSVCGGDMIIDTADEKKAAAKLMRESGWKHTSCG